MKRRVLFAAGLVCLALCTAGVVLPAEPHPQHRFALGAVLFTAALGAVALLFRNRNDIKGE